MTSLNSSQAPTTFQPQFLTAVSTMEALKAPIPCPKPLRGCVQSSFEVGVKDPMDRGLGQTIPVHTHYTLGFTGSVRPPPLPSDQTNHQVVISWQPADILIFIFILLVPRIYTTSRNNFISSGALHCINHKMQWFWKMPAVRYWKGEMHWSRFDFTWGPLFQVIPLSLSFPWFPVRVYCQLSKKGKHVKKYSYKK